MEFEPRYIGIHSLSYPSDVMEGFARHSVVDIGATAGLDEAPPLSATIDCANIAGIGLSDVRFTAGEEPAAKGWQAYRLKQRVNRDGLDAYLLRVKLSEPDADPRTRGSTCRLYDLDKEFSINLTPGRYVSVMIPKYLMLADLGALHAKPISALSAGLLGKYIVQLGDNIKRIPLKEAAVLREAIVAMTTSALAYLSSTPCYRSSESDDTLSYKARRYILDNVSSKIVTVDSTCRAMGVSRATLYRSFENQSVGLSEYIKLHRYRRVLRSLASSGNRGLSRVVDTVEACGFTYNSMFVSNFKQYFGVTPVRAKDFAFLDEPLSGLAVGIANSILHAF